MTYHLKDLIEKRIQANTDGAIWSYSVRDVTFYLKINSKRLQWLLLSYWLSKHHYILRISINLVQVLICKLVPCHREGLWVEAQRIRSIQTKDTQTPLQHLKSCMMLSRDDHRHQCYSFRYCYLYTQARFHHYHHRADVLCTQEEKIESFKIQKMRKLERSTKCI